MGVGPRVESHIYTAYDTLRLPPCPEYETLLPGREGLWRPTPCGLANGSPWPKNLLQAFAEQWVLYLVFVLGMAGNTSGLFIHPRSANRRNFAASAFRADGQSFLNAYRESSANSSCILPSRLLRVAISRGGTPVFSNFRMFVSRARIASFSEMASRLLVSGLPRVASTRRCTMRGSLTALGLGEP